MWHRSFSFIVLFLTQAIYGIEIDSLRNALFNQPSPFNYPLETQIISGKKSNEDVILCSLWALW